jgi:hypothetical protein
MKTFLPRLYLSLITGLLIVFLPLVLHGSTPLKPLNGKTVSVRIGQKEHIWHFVTRKEPVKLEISGPVKIEILTRLALPKPATGKYSYAIAASEEGTQLKEYHTTSESSDASFIDDPAVPAKSRKWSLNVPDGEHTITFTLAADLAEKCALRFMHSGKNNLAKAMHGRSVRIEPLSFGRVATAVVGEKLITYYVATRENPVQLHVIGPTDIVVDARLNFDAKMLGKQTYTLNIAEGSKTLLTAPLKTTKSVGAYYQDWKEVVPGKINILRLNVPEGDHTYQLSLSDGVAQSVSLKFSIPERDVANTKK